MPGDPHLIQDALAGTYAFERELGRGGMATVYLVHDRKHDRRVALKVLLPQLAQALGTERFLREIRTAARLQHPHLLGVIDSGEAAGQLWFTMPFVDGESLRDRLKREGRLPVDEALRITREAARALDYANAQGVVHRDIKPENILLTRDGSTLVADFGIARTTGGDAVGLTQTGFVLGTPAYMSPEQAVGDKAIDGRSDVYALAAVLHEMLTGAPPFTGESAQAIVMKRFSEPPPGVRVARPEVPAALDVTIRRGLAPVAAERFATAGEFARALGDAATPATRVRAAPRPRPGRGALVPALLLGLAIGSGVLYAWRRAASPAGQGAAAAPAARNARPVRLAVLPFSNRGDSSDAYFAEGIADAVRGKLAELRGVEVIAGTSSERYARSTKPLPQIAEELGVDYILTGAVRWARQPDGASRVQVSPELVELADGTARTRWQQPVDGPLSDVFRVQAEIADKVVGALRVELEPPDSAALAEAPTRNLEAYTAFLRSKTERDLKRRVAYLEEAVAKDSSFTAAWAGLAGFSTRLAQLDPALIGRTRYALARAMALDSSARDVYIARMIVKGNLDSDPSGSLALARESVRHYPNDAYVLYLAGIAESDIGQPDSGLVLIRRAAELDPVNTPAWVNLGHQFQQRHRFDEARAALERALVLAPDHLDAARLLVVNAFWVGRGAEGARQVAAPQLAGPNGRMFAAITATANDLYWLLTPDEQERLLLAGIDDFQGDSAGRALVFAAIQHQRGRASEARAWGDSAARYFSRDRENEYARVNRALSLAYAGRLKEAAALLRAEVARSSPGEYRSFALAYLARVNAMSREPAAAVEAIQRARRERVVEFVLPAWLKGDPVFDPIRGDPTFAALTR